MPVKNAIRYLSHRPQAVLKKCHHAHNFNFVVFIAVLVIGAISSTFMVTDSRACSIDLEGSIALEMAAKEWERQAVFTVEIHPNSALYIPDDMHFKSLEADDYYEGIKAGPGVVINIRQTAPHDTGTPYTGRRINLWLELPQEKLDIKEVTITEWSKLHLRDAYGIPTAHRIKYASSTGRGILKLKRVPGKLISDEQKPSFHGSAIFSFTDPLFLGICTRPSLYINWTF